MRVALAQLNTVVGDIDGNADRIAAALADAGEAGADVTLVPELAVSGYPPEDLLLRPAFAAACRRALDRVAAGVRRGVAVIGFPEWDGDCHNAAAIVAAGRVQAVYRKRFLPNYGVFDEARYFRAGERPMVVEAFGARLGIAVCEDIWYPSPVAADIAAGRVRPGLLHLGLAVPPGQGRPPRGDARDARRRLRGRAGLLQPGGRPGRAGLRRPLGALRRRRRAGGPRAPVRGAPAGGGGRPRPLGAPAAARAARQAPAGRAGRRGRGDRRRPGGRATAASRPARPSPPRAGTSPRCGPPCAPACATTWTRTASPGCSWACPAGSTRRSPRPSPPTRSGRTG